MWFKQIKESQEIDYLIEVKDFHRRFVQPYKGKPKGCSSEEISLLERIVGFELPLAYKQYLAFMGRDYNGIFVGSDWFITNIENNIDLVPELLAENGISFDLPEHYLCFFSHQGYMAQWFELPKIDDNPPCWYFHEVIHKDKPVIEGRFTDVLLTDMKGLASCLPTIYG